MTILTRGMYKISCETVAPSKRLYIGQGDIVEKFTDNNLFPKDNFKSIDHSTFRLIYTSFAENILKYIKKQIKLREMLDSLSKEELHYDEAINGATYFIQIAVDSNYDNIKNLHEEYKSELEKILSELDSIQAKEYFKKFSSSLKEIKNLLYKVYSDVNNAFINMELEKSIIVSAVNEYGLSIKEAATSKEKDQSNYLEKRQLFVSLIVDTVKEKISENIFPSLPKKVSGISKNSKFGFCFNSEASYNDIDVLEDFLAKMFIQKYANIDMLKKIDSTEELVEAIKGCSEQKDIDNLYKNNLSKFLDDMCKQKDYIIDMSQDSESIGNTLGELSLAYFKYIMRYEEEKSIFLIDQPEDHISNNNISKNLMRYFNSIRNKKQIIIVTHNPLLVVNQDVDNVIFVKQINDKIKVISNCLEYEDEENSILDIIANNMDGGKDSIEKRLKVYGKENHIENASE